MPARTGYGLSYSIALMVLGPCPMTARLIILGQTFANGSETNVKVILAKDDRALCPNAVYGYTKRRGHNSEGDNFGNCSPEHIHPASSHLHLSE